MSQHDRETDEVKRKPYRKPQLHVYGDLRAITGAVKMTGRDDGGSGNNKTH
jgi:hypothetical protein